MTDPDALTAAFTWLQNQRGIGRPGDVHAGHLLAHCDRLAYDWHTMRDQRDQARQIVADLAEAVDDVLADLDEERPDALARLVHAISQLPAITEARPPATESAA